MRRLAPLVLCLAAPAGAAPLAPIDLDGLALGPLVEGPVGVSVDSSFVAGEVATGDFSGGAACPAGFAECAPPTNPADTLYTFVQTVVPGVDAVANDAPFASEAPAVDPGPVVSYTVAFRPAGFTGAAGYSVSDATAAGVELALDRPASGELVFSVTSGEWTMGETLRFFFETTQPPSGPGGAYALGGEPAGVAPGPLPAPIPLPAGLPLLVGALGALGLRSFVRARSRAA